MSSSNSLNPVLQIQFLENHLIFPQSSFKRIQLKNISPKNIHYEVEEDTERKSEILLRDQ